MEAQVFQEVRLEEIGRCPWQPRKRFDGAKFDELVRSVAEKGVLEPILLRPLEEPVKEKSEGFPTCGKKVGFQLVAGERRFRAAWSVAVQNGGSRQATIPAMVRSLTDDEAFDIMTIENLHREDLSELEEAESFRAYLDRHGMEALAALAERTGIHERYIRRRVRLLELPAQALEAWGKGEIAYGFLEQLNRLKDRKEIVEIMAEIREGRNWKLATVRGLKEWIDEQSPKLDWAKFDRTECLACSQNSDIQTELFETEALKGAHCLDVKCFKKKQNNWFQAHWKQTGFYKQHGTTGFRFEDSLPYGHFHNWYSGGPKKQCRSCESFVTRLTLNGKGDPAFVCVGEEKCFESTKKNNANTRTSKSGLSVAPDQRQPDEPRVAWHGQYFREQFLKEQLPLRLGAVPAEDEKSLRVALFSLVNAERDAQHYFCKERKLKDPEDDWDDLDEDDEESREAMGFYRFVPDRVIWADIEAMPREDVLEWLKKCSMQSLVEHAGPDVRLAAGRHLGIDLAREWRITKEYLDKKTTAEIHAIAEKFKLWERKEAQTFLFEVLNKKRGNFRSCRKDELCRILLESGMDLAGVVPREILATDPHGQNQTEEGEED